MASSDNPAPPSNGSGPPSLVPSRASSVLSTPPELSSHTSDPFLQTALFGGDAKLPSHPQASSTSPPLPQVQPGSHVKASSKSPPQLGVPENDATHSEPAGGAASSHGSASPPEVVVTSYSQDEVAIDPALRDQFLTSSQHSNGQESQETAASQRQWDSLPPIQTRREYHPTEAQAAGSAAAAGVGVDENSANLPIDPELSLPQIQANQNGGVPSFTLAGWNLPGLGGMGYGAGGDDSTRPSTQTNSPTSPTGGSHGLWASSFEGSMTDFNSYTSGAEGDSGMEGMPGGGNGKGNGMSAASSESGFEVGGATVAGSKDEEGGVPPPSKKKSHARKQPEGHIKRARNAFILFRKHITDSNLIPPSVEVKHQNISVVAAKMWKEAPQEVRQKFQEEARIEKEEHQRKYPGYRYQPVFRRTDIIRRRVRKDPAEDEKVEAVAEALIQGKAGEALESEIKDQMVSRSEASESEAESTRSTSRRRRRDVGQLSKGAIRAQRAQARAKQMRQNLLGTNLLNMSLYNAATNRIANSAPQPPHPHHHSQAHQHAYSHAMQAPPAHGGYPPHPGAQHYASGMYTMDGYMPMGYDLDGQPIPVGPGAGGAYDAEMYAAIPAGMHAAVMGMPQGTGHESEMYRLPPIEGMVDVGTGYEAWQNPMGAGGGAGPGHVEYWDQPIPGPEEMGSQLPPQGSYADMHEEQYYAASYELAAAPPDVGGGVDEQGRMEGVEGVASDLGYRLPPLMETSRDETSGIDAYRPDTHDPSRLNRGSMAGNERPSDLIASSYAAAAASTAVNNTGASSLSVENRDTREDSQARLRNIRDWTRTLAQSPETGSVSAGQGAGGSSNQQTPSGHVLFNERLFDGALGTAGFQDQDRSRGENVVGGTRDVGKKDTNDDALGMFDQAMEQAGQVSW
ncbi:specific transcriptional repressor [Kwoniella heveanensis CBS 569]|nr:specific transcriptional repressor [Kwoniella heveanensis CBS 569]